MKTTSRRLVRTWLIGIFVGTLLIALTSPWFVRSYLPLHADPIRGVWTLPAASTYRWRSEGYADSQIGFLGMPGKGMSGKGNDGSAIDSAVKDGVKKRISLWGDSQAEGVCLDDADKLFAQIERESSGEIDVFPLARSGEDAADWVTQMPAVERALNLDHHVLLIAQLSDLEAAVEAPVPSPSDSDASMAKNALAARLPAFVIQSARHLLTENDGVTRRQLRFGLGPVWPATDEGDLVEALAPSDLESKAELPEEKRREKWRKALAKVRAASELPITLLYAPLSPHIIDGQVRWDDPDSDDFHLMRSVAEEFGLQLIDARDALRDSVQQQGRWPHGFHNGQIGAGHLNQVGNEILASQLADALLRGRESRN